MNDKPVFFFLQRMGTDNKTMKIFHKIISLVFQPLLMPVYAMTLLVDMDVFRLLPSVWKWVAIGGTLLFTGILPLIPIVLMIMRGEVKDLFIETRQERTLPYIFSCIAYGFWNVFLWRTLQLPLFIVLMGGGATLSLIWVLLINLKWKISAHMSAMGGFTASVIGVCFRMGMNPVWLISGLFVLSALVALSRLELKAHTPAQVLSGFVLGFLLVFLPALFF